MALHRNVARCLTTNRVRPRTSIQKILLATAVALATSVPALAQEKPAPPAVPPGPPEVGPRLDHMMAELTRELKLSDEQAHQIREIIGERMQMQQDIFSTRQEDRRASREENRAAREEMRASMIKLRQESDAKVKELLDEQQAAAFDKYMENHGPRRGERGMRRKRSR